MTHPYLNNCILFCCLITISTSIIIIIPETNNSTSDVDDIVIVNILVEDWHSVDVVVIVIIGVNPIEEWHYITYCNQYLVLF